jgi:peroxiredoxin
MVKKRWIILPISLFLLVAANLSVHAGNEGLSKGETIPNPEFLVQNAFDYDQMPRPVRLYDYKDGQNLLIAFMPDISAGNNYANVMTSAFDTYFAEGLALRAPFSYYSDEQPLKVLVVTNNDEAQVREYLEKMNLDFDMVSDINMDFANFFGISKWNSSRDASFVYVVNQDNKITYSSHDYKGEGEKLKAIQGELFTLLDITQEVSPDLADYQPLLPGDDARDFAFSYLNKEVASTDPDGMLEGRLSDYFGKKNVIIAFYPAPFSMSCAMEVTKFDKYAEEKGLKEFAENGFSDIDGTEILMVSVTNGSILSKWRDDMGLKNLTLISDFTGEISAKYNSYNPLGWNQRTVFLVNKKGKVTYIDWSYNVDESDFGLLEDRIKALN